MTVYEVPLSPTPQTFGISLGGINYQMTIYWVVGCGWVLNIADQSNAPIVNGIPLVTGADLLAQYAYLGFTGSLVVQTDHAADATPTFDNLGVTSHLFYVS
jgi:hypothetical protein